jgi:serine/threonine protein kinase
MGQLVLGLVKSIHSVGVCHRDLHRQNLVIDDGRPLVIDLELACEADPSGPCYDLYGPSEIIPVAEQHQAVEGDYARYGVWWDSPADGLNRVFGPLSNLRPTKQQAS